MITKLWFLFFKDKNNVIDKNEMYRVIESKTC